MKTSTLAAMVLAVAGLGGIAACSSSATPAPTTTTDPSATHIKASEGGTVSDPGGNASLSIPAGALAMDTDITLKVAVASGEALTSIYDFGPDGTTFTTAATLTIKAAASLAPAGKTLVVAMSSGGNFQAIEGSTYAAGVASAKVGHFTMFSVIAVESAVDAGSDAPVIVAMDAGADAPVVVAGDCPFVGTYTLEKYLCGTTDITLQWKTVIPTDTLVVTNKAGTGCSMQLTHTAPACVESETLSATLVSGSNYTFSFLGITSCAPAACKFATNDAPCMVGDRVQTDTSLIELQGAKLHIVEPGTQGDVCGGQAADLLFAP